MYSVTRPSLRSPAPRGCDLTLFDWPPAQPICLLHSFGLQPSFASGRCVPTAQADCLLALSREANVALLYAGFDEFGALVMAHALPRLSVELVEAVERHVELNRESDRPSAEWSTRRTASTGSNCVPVGAQP